MTSFSVLATVAMKSTVVLAAAWLAVLILRKSSAGTRHLLWTGAAAALLVLPFLMVSLPAWRVPASRLLAPLDPSIVFTVTATAKPGAANLPSAPAAFTGVQRAPWRPSLASAVAALWALGAILGIAQMLVACIAMMRLRRKSQPFPDYGLGRDLGRCLGILHDVEILQTESGRMPIAYGLLRPAVFLPADAEDWSLERMRIVLLHELAHIRRGDLATHLIARTALSLYWWNPLAWAAWRQFLKERERAADDLVLASGARASEYAGHLLEIARSLRPAPVEASAAIAMARSSELEGRLLAILDDARNRRAPRPVMALAAVLAAVLVAIPLATVRAQDNPTREIPADVEATIRTATSQRNYEVLDRAAQAYEKAEDYETARQLLDSALAVRAQVGGEASAEYAAGLVKLGDLAAKQHRDADAQNFYRKAVTLDDTPATTPALIYLGRAALHAKDYEGARSFFERARNAGRTAVMWLAIVAERLNDAATAETLFLQAIQMGDPNTPEAALAMELYQHLLAEQGRASEAEAFKDRAAAIRKAHVSELAAAAERDFQASGSAPGLPAYRVGGGVSAPRLLMKREPEYSEEARAAKYQGTALLGITVGTDGAAHNIRLVRSLGLGLDEKAMEAISKWKFQPGEKDGQPVPVQATVEVNFRLM